jgi:4-hydroxy-2-oxoglutarate aldolase
MLYSVPANTGLDMPIEAIVELSHHPQIIGIKDSGGSVAKLGMVVANTEPSFQVLAGSAGFFLGALAVGAVGSVAALANIAAERLNELHQSFQQGELDNAGDIQRGVIEINDAVTRRYGVAGLKAAMDLMGMHGGSVRRPLLPLGETEIKVVRELLEATGLLGQS